MENTFLFQHIDHLQAENCFETLKVFRSVSGRKLKRIYIIKRQGVHIHGFSRMRRAFRARERVARTKLLRLCI